MSDATPSPTRAELSRISPARLIPGQGTAPDRTADGTVPLRHLRVLVELNPTVDARQWALRHASGEVPDRMPYGLDRLGAHGMTVLARRWPASRPGRFAGRAVAHAGGEFRWLESMLGFPSPGNADARLCWDERTAVPALLARRGDGTPLVTGVIWMTEPGIGSRAGRAVAGRALQRAEAVFTSSWAQAEAVRRDFGVARRRIEVVPFAVDTDFWRPRSSPEEPPPSSLVVSVGNDRHRNHEVMTAAMRDVVSDVPDARLELVTRHPVDVGPELGVRTPHLSHRELRALYRRAGVAVVASRSNLHVSGLTATLEAMSMGLPLVTTSTPGMDEYVTDGFNGLLVPPGDVAALAAAVTELLHDPARAAELGANAHLRARTHFSTERHAADLARIVRHIS